MTSTKIFFWWHNPFNGVVVLQRRGERHYPAAVDPGGLGRVHGPGDCRGIHRGLRARLQVWQEVRRHIIFHKKDPDLDPGPAIFIIDLQDANKNWLTDPDPGGLKHMDLTDPEPDPQHCIKHCSGLDYLNSDPPRFSLFGIRIHVFADSRTCLEFIDYYDCRVCYRDPYR